MTSRELTQGSQQGKANLAALADLSGQWIDAVHARRPTDVVVLDMDSSVSPTHGEQEGTAYNGHFGCTCYHPLFVFNQFGDLERCALRSGNVHSADAWRSVLGPVVARYRDRTGIAPQETTKAIEVAIMLRWTLPSRNSAFWLDRNLAILASVRGGWAAHLGNVG